MVLRTPVVPSQTLTQASGAPVHLKLEHLQKTGSFKLRGATNAVLALGETARANGVVGVSTGNHGRGLAFAARQAGIRCIICMAIGGFLRLRNWIPRRAACGSPCQLCRVKCNYNAIKPTGGIRYDECFQCLDCVTIHDDDNQCVPLILAKRGREL